jgi:transposase-like protein
MSESEKRAMWRDRVAAFERSGMSRSAWCARHGVKVATLDYWRVQLAHEPVSNAKLIPIRVVPAVSPARRVSLGEIKIELGGAVCLHTSSDVDADWLAALLRGLR